MCFQEAPTVPRSELAAVVLCIQAIPPPPTPDHVLTCPRPRFWGGGSQGPPMRWKVRS